MNLKGYKFYDNLKTRRSAEVLDMLPGENPQQFKKRCAANGFECVDGRNLVDWYKFYNDDLIRGDLEAKRNPNLYVLCQNIINDFNVASIIRACNINAVKEIFIFGNRRIDYKTGSVGAHHYENLSHVQMIEDLDKIINNFDIVVGVDNIKDSINVSTYEWNYNKKTLLVFGNESIGIAGEIIERCDDLVYIPQKGCIRSLSVAQAAAVILYDYNSKMDI